MKKWYSILFLSVFVSNAFAVDFDSIGDVADEEEYVEEAPAAKSLPAKKSTPADKSKGLQTSANKKMQNPKTSKTIWSLGLNYNPLGGIYDIDPNSGIDPRIVEGNMVVSGGVQFNPSYRILLDLGYNSNKDINSNEKRLISLGLGLDYFLRQSPDHQVFFTLGLDYLTGMYKTVGSTTNVTAYALSIGFGAEYKLSSAFSLGMDVTAKYGEGRKPLDSPTPGSLEIKNTSIWMAPSLRLIWNL